MRVATALVWTAALAAAVPLAACSRAELPPEARGEVTAGSLLVAGGTLEIATADGGYGLTLLAGNADGSAGSAAFMAVFEGGTTELRLVDWTAEAVESRALAQGIGPHLRMVRDDAGRRLIVFHDALRRNLSLLVEDAGDWRTQVIDDSGDVGRHVAAVWAAGALHMAYLDDSAGNVRYARWADGALLEAPQVIDTGIERGQVTMGGRLDGRIAIAFSRSGRPIMTYQDASNGQLRVAWQVVGDQRWQVDVLGTHRRAVSVVPDAEGMVVLRGGYVPRHDQFRLYADAVSLGAAEITFLSDRAFRIATARAGVEYSVDYVEPLSDDYGRWSSLAVGSGDVVWLSFFDARAGDLLLARNDALGSRPDWQVYRIATDGVVGDYNELLLVRSIDDSGRPIAELPVVFHQDQTRNALVLALYKDGAWFNERIDAVGVTGFNPAAVQTEAGPALVGWRVLDPRTFTSSIRIARVWPAIR